jgi:pyruvate dehydrogenase E1 component
MYEKNENIFYYITLMNENYIHPEMPKGAKEGILKGAYLYKKGNKSNKLQVQLMGSGTIFNEVIEAATLLKDDFNVESTIWSILGVNQLHREGVECERYNLSHPTKKQKVPYLTQIMEPFEGPVVISTDYIRAYSEQIRGLIPQKSVRILGTDGFGRSDTRENLRRFFEVDRYYIALTALKSLADEGKIPVEKVDEAIKRYHIEIDKPNPLLS